MRVIADVTRLENHAAGQLLLDVEVVLINIRRAQMRINQEEAARTAERFGAGKTSGRTWGRGRERVGRACSVGGERI